MLPEIVGVFPDKLCIYIVSKYLPGDGLLIM